jgi:hypothetical protein
MKISFQMSANKRHEQAAIQEIAVTNQCNFRIERSEKSIVDPILPRSGTPMPPELASSRIWFVGPQVCRMQNGRNRVDTRQKCS